MESTRLDEVVPRGMVSVEARGFQPYESIHITAPDLNTASKILGKETREQVSTLINEKRNEKDFEDRLKNASDSLRRLQMLSVAYSEKFTTPDEINHLENYLGALENFAIGAGISINESALMQIEDQVGCQTLVVQNTESGEVAAIHTEEDADEYARSKNPKWGKRWVDMTVGNRKIQFCSYPGICSFGSASGISEQNGKTYFQAVDVIGQTVKGDLWANSVAFMFMDAGNIEFAEKMADNLKTLPKPIFQGGYIVHAVEGAKAPRIATFEFGGNTIESVPPEKSVDKKGDINRLIQIGVNYPRSKDLQAIDEYNSPRSSEESEDEYQERIAERKIMERRIRRLIKIGQLVGKKFKLDLSEWGENNVLKVATRVMKNKHGDWLDDWFSGLANDLVAQNDTLYVSSKGEMKLIVRKGYPKLRK
ncbi:MAG: hypothetical protein Q8L28_01595 [bacterium]|nr:hypothetical protein [bacterium]